MRVCGDVVRLMAKRQGWWAPCSCLQRLREARRGLNGLRRAPCPLADKVLIWPMRGCVGLRCWTLSARECLCIVLARSMPRRGRGTRTRC